MAELPALLDAALLAARAAGERILPHFLRAEAERKPDGSAVTEADRASERRLRELLGERFPGHALLGEEYGRSGPAGSRWTWVLDPLDGTAGFVLGVPLFGVLVGLLEDGEPIVGVIHFPALEETVYAARGSGCWFERRGEGVAPVRVAPAAPLEGAAVSIGALAGTDLAPGAGGRGFRFSEALRRARTVRFVPDCYQHALVCRGRLHAAIDPVMHPWDIAALVPCVEEAGGVTTTLAGRRAGIVDGGSLLSSCGGETHAALLALAGPAPAAPGYGPA